MSMVKHNINFGDLLRRAAHTHLNKVALIRGETGEMITYRQFLSKANRFSRVLKQKGIGKGDRVALLERNIPEFIEQYMSIVQIGAVVVPLNFRLTVNELEYIIKNAAPKLLVFENEFIDKIDQLKRLDLPIKSYIAVNEEEGYEDYYTLITADKDASDIDEFVAEDEICSILYTAGTTGRPKGAVRSHYAVNWTTMSYAMGMYADYKSVYFAVPPFFHIAGSECSAFSFLAQGGTVITLRNFDPVRYLELVQQYGVTHCFVVPAMAIRLVNLDWSAYDLTSIKVWFSASAPLPSTIRDKLLQALPGVTIINAIGTTEVSPITNLYTPLLQEKPSNCVGKSWFGTEVAILDDEGNVLPPGQVGNLAVRSPGVMDGYLNNPKANEEVFMNGWYMTGDLAEQDEEGYLYLTDRKRDMIISGGENVYAVEVEDVIFRMNNVKEVAVIGMPDEQWGEVPMAVVVKKDENVPLTEGDIIEFCKQYLAKYKVPSRVVFIDELPRNTFGKVMKFVLREEYAKKETAK